MVKWQPSFRDEEPPVPWQFKAAAAVLLGLAATLTALRLTGRIDWPWVWVLAPAWVPVALVACICAYAVILSKIEESQP